MANLFTVTIPDSAAALLVSYGAGAVIRVQSSPTEGGLYGDVTTLPIVAGQSVYPAYDPLGTASDWYKVRYEAADGDPASVYTAAFQPMASDAIYASLSAFNNFLRDTGADPADDVLKLLALDASSRAIDRATNRRFEIATGIQTARVFTPTSYWDHRTVYGYPAVIPNSYAYGYATRYVVTIDDTTDTNLTINFDSTGNGAFTLANTTFRLGPVNAPSRGLPYSQILFDSGTTPLWEVEVTADWGWSAVPATVTAACLLQASRFFVRRNSPYGVAGSPDMGNEIRLLAKLDPDVQTMLASYRRGWGAV